MKLSRLTSIIVMSLLLAACNKPSTIRPDVDKDELLSEQVNQQVIVDGINAQGGQPKRWKNHKNMRGQFERVGEKIEKAGAEVCRGLKLQRNGCYYYFKMSRDEEINAKADGKNIIINTGMMRFVESDDELAAVMGHEFTHNLMQHKKSQGGNISWGVLLGVAADALASSRGIDTGGEMPAAGADIAGWVYGSDFEREADYIGLYVMTRAGYDIKKAPQFLRRMSVEEPEGIYNSVTHPSNPERFVALQKTISEIEFKRRHNIPLLPDMKAE
jgi:predicted Zn-dependent protease